MLTVFWWFCQHMWEIWLWWKRFSFHYFIAPQTRPDNKYLFSLELLGENNKISPNGHHKLLFTMECFPCACQISSCNEACHISIKEFGLLNNMCLWL